MYSAGGQIIPLSPTQHKQLESVIRAMERKGLIVVGVASKNHKIKTKQIKMGQISTRKLATNQNPVGRLEQQQNRNKQQIQILSQQDQYDHLPLTIYDSTYRNEYQQPRPLSYENDSQTPISPIAPIPQSSYSASIGGSDHKNEQFIGQSPIIGEVSITQQKTLISKFINFTRRKRSNTTTDYVQISKLQRHNKQTKQNQQQQTISPTPQHPQVQQQQISVRNSQQQMRKTAQVKKHSFLSASSSDETQEEEIISDQRQQNQNQNKNQRPNSSQVYKSQFPGLEGIEPEIENGIGNPLLDLSRKQSGSNINKRIDEEEEEGFGDSDEDNAEVLRDAYIRQKKYQNELLQYNTDQQQTLIKADEKGGYTLIALLGVGTDTQMSAISSLGFLQKLNNLSFKGNQQLPIEILTDSNVAFQNKLYPASIIRLLPNIQINQNVSSSEAIEKIKQLQNEGKRVIVASAGLGEMDEIKVLESGDVGICVGNKGTSSWFHILKKHQQMEQMKEQHDDEPRSEYKSEFKDESKEMININMLTSSLKSMRKATKSIADSGISRVALSIQMSRNIICSINRAISLCFANMIGFVLITLLETILGIRILNIRPIFGVLLFIITQLIGSAAIVVGTVSGALWDLERAVNKDEPPRSDQIKQELDEIKYAQRNRKRQIEKNKLLSDEKIRETQNDQNNKPFVYQLSLSFWRRTILLALAEVILVIFLLFLWGNDAQMLDNEDRRERCSLLWIQSLNMKVNNNIYHYDIQNISSNAIYLQDAVEASPLLFPDSICKQHSILSGSNDNSVAIFSQRHIAVVAQFIIYSHILGILAIAFASFGDTSIGFKNFSYKMRQFIKRKNREHKEKKIQNKKNKMKQDSYDMYTEQDEDYSNFFTKSITRDMTRNWRNRNMSISNFSAILIFVLCAFILAYVIIMLSSAQRQFFFPGLKQSYALSLSFAALGFSFIYFFFQTCFW